VQSVPLIAPFFVASYVVVELYHSLSIIVVLHVKDRLRFLGIVSRPLGTDGTFILADTERHIAPLLPKASVHIGFSGQFTKEFSVIHCKKHGTGYAMKLVGIVSPESAQMLKEQAVFVEEFMMVKKDSEYYVDEVIGCTVVDDITQAVLGSITDVWTLPANDAWVMEYRGQEIPIPVIPDTIRHVDIRTKIIRVQLPDGLLTLHEYSDHDDTDEEE
jgi:16S rRNA processing protein RimM